jgi:hypothetical protein
MNGDQIYELLKCFLSLGFSSWLIYLIVGFAKTWTAEQEKTKREEERNKHELAVIKANQDFNKGTQTEKHRQEKEIMELTSKLQ